jgi:hypothetical protein
LKNKTYTLASLGPTVRLFFRWLPGHEHGIVPHQRADTLSRTAREVQRSYWPQYDNIWKTYMESPTMRWLKQDLLRASLRSAAIWPRLKRRLRYPRHLSPGTKCGYDLRPYLDAVLPVSALGTKAMPAEWSVSRKAVLTFKSGRKDIEVSVPAVRSDHRGFVNDGVNSFAVEIDNPDPAEPRTDLVLYGCQ